MGKSRASFIGVDIDVLTMDETLERVHEAMRTRKRQHHVALNVAKFVKLRSDSELRADIACSDLVGIDGMGVVFAARLMGIKVPERVAGVDLMQEVIALCAREGYRPYFLGARPDVLQTAIANIRRRYPSIEIAGAQHGYYEPGDEMQVVESIRESGADCLFIAMPTPTKEHFLAVHRDQLEVPFIMGVGGSIDVVANYVKRAPIWMQQSGLEWLFRVMQEPRRMWKRYLVTNAAFLVIVARALVGIHPPISKV
ncbi:WecB/TagA/CpsF family glycosyltransferase [Telmatospirillum sp.]|uniref:WecB/TagA/CpsF family glycosyltransferase n=1 Tax=Telmatospirillum sp. TaxID=2079197 RepID=UPI00285134E7|nr:WecB/TagA/CpsF family glycosyltransferase [Telmatospirillum sp.]MDR3437635.1 WecB/TagA/CpsF family glycosyltransferase [Telmatospirillum sp.]